MVLAIIGAGVLVAAVATRMVCAFRLLHGYRVADYLATPESRRLYWASTTAVPMIGGGLMLLAVASDIWWVELAGALFLGATIAKSVWIVRMRLSGRYQAFYRERGWR